MAIQLSALQDAYNTYKQDTTDVDDTTFIQWAKFILFFVYGRLKALDPERFMTQNVYYVDTDPDTFTLPSDLMDFRQTGCGFFELSTADIAYDGQTVAFAAAATLTGGTSGATAVIVSDDDDGATGTLTVKNVNGVFQDNELITDGSGGSATANGAPVYSINNGNRLGETGFGSTDEGFYLNRSNLVFTGASTKSFVGRYLPKPIVLSATTEYFTLDGTASGVVIIEDRHEEYLIKACDVLYEQWDDNNGAESVSDFRMVRALGDVLETYKRTANVAKMDNPINNY